MRAWQTSRFLTLLAVPGLIVAGTGLTACAEFEDIPGSDHRATEDDGEGAGDGPSQQEPGLASSAVLPLPFALLY